MYLRLSNYYQEAHLAKRQHSSLICRALIKHGMQSFTLVILEISPDNLAIAEQFWIDFIKPEYNIQLNVLVPQEHSGNLKPDRTGQNNSFYGRTHTDKNKALFREIALSRTTLPKPGHSLTITDTVTGSVETYPSIRKGAEAMGWDQANIMRFLRNNTSTKLYRKRYSLEVNKE